MNFIISTLLIIVLMYIVYLCFVINVAITLGFKIPLKALYKLLLALVIVIILYNHEIHSTNTEYNTLRNYNTAGYTIISNV